MKINKSNLFVFFLLNLIFVSCKTQKPTVTTDTVKTPEKSLTYEDPYLGKTDESLTVSEKYIKKYRDLAISEMKRSKVPASITLAQGILESGNGNSYLAQKANNHFGIKCGSNWKGESIFFDDDQSNECFRKYKTAEESYLDHSDFLSKNTRYEALFQLDILDYKGWAKGLKEAGYATRRNYAELLIDLIEKHKLYVYDVAIPKDRTDPAMVPDQQFKYNGIPAIQVKAGDTYSLIAKRNAIALQKLLEYNDLTEQKPLKEGAIVYLAPKKTAAKESYHIVKKDDRMYDISQEYGIRLVSLYEKNLLNPGKEAAIGEILYLRHKRTEPAETRSITPAKETQEQPIVQESNKEKDTEKEKTEVNEFEEAPVVPSTKEKEVVSPDSKTTVVFEDEEVKPATVKEKTNNEQPVQSEEDKTEPAGKVNMHKVQPGETLYSISKKYGLSVEELKRLNNMTTSELSVGDNLIVGSVAQPVTSSDNKIEEEPKVEQHFDTTFHVVQEDEDLYMIAKMYKTSIVNLLAINRMSSQKVYVGQKVIITLPEQPATPTAKSATTPTSPSKTTSSFDDPDKIVIKKTTAVQPATPPKTETPKTTPPKAESGKEIYHTVQAKETMFSISKLYNIPIASLREWNKLTSDALSIGQKLIVGFNNTEAPKPQPEVINTDEAQYHTVQPGETLYAISKKYNISVVKIVELNSLKDNNIKSGQKLRVK